jgi:hypothetical protein
MTRRVWSVNLAHAACADDGDIEFLRHGWARIRFSAARRPQPARNGCFKGARLWNENSECGKPWMLAEIAFHQRNIYSAGATPDSGILCPAPPRPPQTSEELRAAILDSYEDLSKRLQQIARYVLDEPNAVALETLAVVGERAGVQPSAIVRFAKAIGFESASQMQKVIRDGLIAGSAVLGYSERVPSVQRRRGVSRWRTPRRHAGRVRRRQRARDEQPA